MKLGEALTVRRRQADKLNDLRGRIKVAAVVQEGDTPAEDIDELQAAFEALSLDHGELIQRINETNRIAVVPSGEPLTKLLAEKDHLHRVRSIIQVAVDAASINPRDYRWSRQEIKMVPIVDVVRSRGRIDVVSARINELDLTIQEVNWATELV